MGRFADPVTEFEVIRLTDPASSSVLPPYPSRSASSRRNLLLYAGDREGAFQVYRLDLRTGESLQLSDAAAVDPGSVTLLPGDQECCYWNGRALEISPLVRPRSREVYRLPDGVERGSGFHVAPGGRYAAFVVKGPRHRLHLIDLRRRAASLLYESDEPVSAPVFRPGQTVLAFREGRDIRFQRAGKREFMPLPLIASGAIGPFRWSPGGEFLFYLNDRQELGEGVTLRSVDVQTGEDLLVAKTTQFADFSPNGDASVFVGASQSKAGPHIILLLRRAKREFTICEHGASDLALVNPVFSPDSQDVFFGTDRPGKPCLYRMRVDRLVEKTES
jgi:oligogalacturonide lyase